MIGCHKPTIFFSLHQIFFHKSTKTANYAPKRTVLFKFAFMILAFFLSEVEIYVLAAVAAAAILAMCVRPAEKGEAKQYLLAGQLCSLDEDSSRQPTIDIECLDNGNVLLTRRGLNGLTDSGAVSLAVTVKGFDIEIEQRTVAGDGTGMPVDTALFTLEFLGKERYHLHYNSETENLSCALTLTNRPDMHVSRQLKVSS